MKPPVYRPGRDPRAQFHPPPAPGPRIDGARRVTVIGGGIAGLTAALALAERGIEVTVLERANTLGGRVRSWPITLQDGSASQMSRGFHAFFRQYYNLRAVLRRVDPTLSMLRPLSDYPLVRKGGGADSFARIPRTPPLNLAAFVARSPSFTLRGLAGVDVSEALGLLDVQFPETFHSLDGVSAAQVLDDLRFPEAARHLALEVFARSFFADPSEFSGGELMAMFHLYFLGSSEGLLFDVPRNDYDSTLWQPLAAHLTALGVHIRTGRTVTHVADGEGSTVRVAHQPSAGGPSDDEQADAVVIALDPTALRELVAGSTELGGSDDAGRAWRTSVQGIQSAPPFAVWRLWLDRAVDAARPAFLGTSGYSVLDNVSVLERFEEHAADWAGRRGGSVVELHAYALPPDADRATVQDLLLTALHEVYPETRDASIVDDQWLLESDCVLVGLAPHSSRPGVRTPDPRIVLAGDAVRCDLPVALMERAATTGWNAADVLLTGWGLPGYGVWSVPTAGRLGGWPGRARRLLQRS